MTRQERTGMESVTVSRLTSGDEQRAINVVRELKTLPENSGHAPSMVHMGRLLANEANHFYVALDRDRPIGFLIAHRFPRIDRDQEMVYLYEIDVLPKYRRQGIGSRLVESLLHDCRTAGVMKIWVATAVDNDAARTLFESTGAKYVEETSADYVYDLDRRTGRLED